MAIECKFRPEHNLAILVQSGTTPDDEFLTFYESFFESDSYEITMNLLVDLREADSRARSSEVLHRFAGFMRETLKNTAVRPKVAVVAPKDLSFGLARMYEVLVDSVPWDFVVFRVMDAALAWLGLPEDLMDQNPD